MSQDRCDLICIDAPRAEAIRERLLDEAPVTGESMRVEKGSGDPVYSGSVNGLRLFRKGNR